MKQQIDDSIAEDEQLQAFLAWVNQKSYSLSGPYKPAVLRAFYFDLAVARILNLSSSTLDLGRALKRD